MGQFNAQQVDWTVFLFRKDYDRTFILGHTGAVYAAPVTTSNCPPIRWGFNMLHATWNEGECHLNICRGTKTAHIEIY
jgi:hypothetical protein